MTTKPYNQIWALWGIMRASLLSSFRNPASIVIGLIFPLIFVLVFGYIGSNNASFEVGIRPNSDTTNPIYEALTKIESLKLRTGQTDAELTNQLATGQLAASISIEETPQLFVQVTTSQAAPAQGEMVLMILGNLINKLNLAAAGITQPLVVLSSTEISGRKFTSIDFILPGQLGFSLMSAGIFATAFVFLSLRQNLVIKRFFTTPVSKLAIIGGEGLSRLIFALLQGAVIVALGYFVFDYTLIHGFLTFIQIMLLSAIGLVVFMGFGFVITSLARDERTIAPFAQLITLPQFLLAGTFFPIDQLPDWLQTLAKILPLTYFNDAIRQIAFEGKSLAAVGPDLGVLAIWGISLYIIASRIFKWEA